LDAGVLAAMTKPLDINLLLSFFHSLSKEPTVAIVDDDPKFCHALGELLRMRGYDVLAVNDPRGAYETITKESQIVLLDMKLNQTNGLEVLQGIRKRHPSLPVVLVTGYRKEMLPAVENALKISAYTCLYKPFQIDELLEILTKLHHRELSKLLQQPF
jgi:DNA-binding NtrC family response regulator